MRAVVLASGGLDSTLLALLATDEGYDVYPLFVNFGQLAASTEQRHCAQAMKRHGVRQPEIADIRGFGDLIPSGLTRDNLHVVDDAFTPGRNTLFLLCAASFAARVGADVIFIGLLDERFHLFSDQTKEFIKRAQSLFELSVGKPIEVRAPLMAFSKAEVIAMAAARSVGPTYSCHTGDEEPCGVCIACQEFNVGGG